MSEERDDPLVENIVAWHENASPKLRDEPAAYKRALIRLGAASAVAALRARAERAEAERDARWKPIETAPRDGTLVLLFEPHSMGGFSFVGTSTGERWFNNLDLANQNPTHWMPLPEPPALAREGGE